MRAGARKQAMVPVGATVLEPVGTAPGLLVGSSPLVAVLPGPPRELQTMWADAVTASPLSELLARAGTLEQRILRFFPLPEPQIAATLRELEPTRCRWRSRPACGAGSSRWRPSSRRRRAAAYAAFEASLRERHGDVLFSDDGATIDEVIARLLAGRTIATAESCTGGLMAGRLTDLAGSSAYVLGGLVVYSNEAKTALAGVPAALIEAHGAVSPEVATALSAGARVAAGGRASGSGSRASPGRAGRAEQARRHGLHLRLDGGRRRGAHGPPPGRPRRRPRPHDDGHAAHAPRAAPADLMSARSGSSSPSTSRPTSATRSPRSAPPRTLRCGGPSSPRRSTSRSRSSAPARPADVAAIDADRRRRGRRPGAPPGARARARAPAAPRARPDRRARGPRRHARRPSGPALGRARGRPASTRPRRGPSARTSPSPGCGPRNARHARHPRLEPRAFQGAAVTLYRSTTHPTGARYEPLARASLR